jgi:multidrug resistance efflux pump
MTVALIAINGIAPVKAQGTSTPGIERNQEELRARIQQGIASGHITQQEAQILFRQEQEITLRENRMKSDGTITPQERQQLRQDLAAMHAEVASKLTNSESAMRQNNGTSDIDHREYQIHERIEQGMRSGHITRDEAKSLSQRVREIERRQARFKSNGEIAQQERRELRRELMLLHDDVERMLAKDRSNQDDRRTAFD